MKVKKILSAVISAAICCSFMPANISAYEFDVQTSSANTVSLVNETVNESSSIIGTFPNSFQLDTTEGFSTNINGISFEVEGGISTYSNSSPIAGLTVMVANPESIVDGNATTDTILYWLWNDGETIYTYDPDGDEITNYVVGGIYEYVTGTVSLGGEAVGFATQITEAGPHNLEFYVVDSYGNKSNIVKASIVIEPADGNKRPICSLKASVGPYYVNSNVIFDWSDSYDEDNGDYITAVRVRIYTDEGYELVTSNSKYYVTANDSGITLTFSEKGNYTVGISVSDNHNAWSNWIGGAIEINEPEPITVLKLADTEWEDSKSVRTKPTGSNSYVNHTLWSRLGGDICVLKGTGGTYTTYTNHNGTYRNVTYDIIAPGTVFMSAETWVSSSNPNSYDDPYFGDGTPRAITQEEIDMLIARGKVNYIVYDPTTLRVIDFYSVLNPLVAYQWSVVTHTP